MRVLCAPDSFKETLAAPAVATAMAEGARRAGSGVVADACPIADGGEGTLEVLAEALGAGIRRLRVTGPVGAAVPGRYAVPRNRIGIVALADASGLAMVPSDLRDPQSTTTRGTGELIGACIRGGCEQLIVCLGGSATIDGAAGIAQTLGGRFLDADSRIIEEPLTGGLLHRVAAYEPPLARLPEIIACCDVRNPLLGPNGAAAVYGPQKGASPEQVTRLEHGLANLARVCGGDPAAPGAGAAGGAGWGLATLLGARLVAGSELVLDAVAFDERLRRCDLLVTGEGCLDAQTPDGKAPYTAALRARARGVPAVAVVGTTGPGAETGPFARVVSLTERFGAQRALEDTAAALAEAVEEVVRT
jgi:glycerate kinase